MTTLTVLTLSVRPSKKRNGSPTRSLDAALEVSEAATNKAVAHGRYEGAMAVVNAYTRKLLQLRREMNDALGGLQRPKWVERGRSSSVTRRPID